MIHYMVGNLAPRSIHVPKELVKYAPGRGFIRVVLSQNGDKFATSSLHELNDLMVMSIRNALFLRRGWLSKSALASVVKSIRGGFYQPFVR